MVDLGFEIHRLSKLMTREHIRSGLHAYICSVTGMHGYFIHYLYENLDHDVYQKDLEKRFSIGRSAVTSALQLMEKNGLIIRESVPQDARLKKIILTEKALELHHQIEQENRAFERRLTEGLTETERETVLNAVRKMRRNLGEDAECEENTNP